MTRHQSALSALVSELLEDPDLAHEELFRRLLQAGLQDLIDAEASVKIGADRYERSPSRSTRRCQGVEATWGSPASSRANASVGVR